ncbi:MAG: MBL fold metallo-hydrolase [Deltaproteobacteria bacterium]|nr:MBL fold metallo-hydrolase [Deltaproteobacteria bacterium]
MEDFCEVQKIGVAGNDYPVIRLSFPSGLTIYGLPTPNQFGGVWGLGPTWNYLVEADQPFLVDAGRWGTGALLLETMRQVGRELRDLAFVLLSHGHEDHDGGLAEVVAASGAAVRAHRVYARLIRQYLEDAPEPRKRLFPAKCYHCFMPDAFCNANCLGYHAELFACQVQEIADGRQALGPDLETLHLPGHSPDALALVAGEEVLLLGDNLLPGITPWPTNLGMHRLTAPALGPEYAQAGQLYGLSRYLRSLNELAALAAERPGLVGLPAHRLYHQGRVQTLDVALEVQQMRQHHRNRCAAILDLLAQGPLEPAALAQRHFPPERLKGPNREMGTREMLCHCELMLEAGAVVRNGRGYEATGVGVGEVEALICGD